MKEDTPTPPSLSPSPSCLSSLPPLASVVPAFGGRVDIATSSAQFPPAVANRIAACQRERAKLRAAAPFLMVKPSEWTESKVAELQAAGADIQARVQAHNLYFWFWICRACANLCSEHDFISISNDQVLKRDPVTHRVTLAMASIPAMDSTVFAGPKGKSSQYCCCSFSLFIFD